MTTASEVEIIIDVKHWFLNIFAHLFNVNITNGVFMTLQEPRSIERMRGPYLGVLANRANRLPFEEALRRADEGRFILASSARLLKALRASDWWGKLAVDFGYDPKVRGVEAYLSKHTVVDGIYSGTFTAYVKPDTVFGKVVESIPDLERVAGSRYFVHSVELDRGIDRHRLYPVPSDYLGAADALLVAQHPNYALHTDGDYTIMVPVGMELKYAVSLVRNFPRHDGWCVEDTLNGIPTTGSSGKGLWVYRNPHENVVGPTIHSPFDAEGVGVKMLGDMSAPLASAVEALNPEIAALISKACFDGF